MPEYVSRHTGVTHIRIAASVPHAEQYRVTVEPVKSKRERKIEWLTDKLPYFTGYDRAAAAAEMVNALEELDQEDP